MKLSHTVLCLSLAVLATLCAAATPPPQPQPQLSAPLQQPCVSIQTVDVQQNHTRNDPREDSILLSCIMIQATTAYVRTGNYSLTENTVSCSAQVAYSYAFAPPQVLPTAGAAHFCVPSRAPAPYASSSSLCAFARAEGRTVWLSAAVSEEQLRAVRRLPFVRTTVNFDFGHLLPMFAYRAATAFSLSVTDPGELRRRVFTGTGRFGACAFYPSHRSSAPPCAAAPRAL